MTKSDHAALVGRTNAICLPSGDQAGKLSRLFVVSRCTDFPFPSIVTIPTPVRAKAMRLPSGENAGAIDAYAPFVSRLRPVPEDRMRKSWSTYWPGGRAAKTSHFAGAAALAVAATAPSASAKAPNAIRITDRNFTLAPIAAF